MSAKTARKDIEVGQLVWAKVAIADDIVDKEAMKTENGGKLSTTAKNIFSGKVTNKLCYVLSVTETRIDVVYGTTFGGKAALPAYVTDSTK
ncbi:hypothetical protein EXIGLDRAFT_758560 [Exidia glandulosa HHB12029]|uniref:Uncharacterized protein n=1 Tax=Exidia glandulosa HHB12029 TaxID=1314781 RepID=A0A165QZ21_EXIGL|nr:hypothetical protein EXIGLDRAFT_758560 [Exidia glandulosa HHB12029]